MLYLKQSFCPKALPINHRMVPCLLWVCLILIVFPSLSKGQDWIGPTPMDYANMNMNFTNTLIMNGVIQRQVEERNGIHTTTSKKAVKKSAVSAAATSAANFAYTATPTQRNAYRDAYIDRLAKTDSIADKTAVARPGIEHSRPGSEVKMNLVALFPPAPVSAPFTRMIILSGSCI